MLHRLLGRRRMPGAGEELGDLGIAGIFALQEDAVEIEDEPVEVQRRSPNRAVPTRTWVAPIVTAVS
jgi:hypothetical protein